MLSMICRMRGFCEILLYYNRNCSVTVLFYRSRSAYFVDTAIVALEVVEEVPETAKREPLNSLQSLHKNLTLPK